MSKFAPFPAWKWDIPAQLNIGAACLDTHLRTPVAERVAMVVDDEKLGVSQITFAELAARSSRFAQLLRDLGVVAGERVLIRLPNSLDYPTAFFGTMKRGAIAVPSSTLLTAEELLYLVRDSGARTLVTDIAGLNSIADSLRDADAIDTVLLSGRGETIEIPGVSVLPLDAALANVGSMIEPTHSTRADDPAYLIYTSGTSGYPKGVLHAHRALLGHAPAWKYWFDFSPDGDRILHSGKFNWTYVLGTALMDPLHLGKTVIVHEGKTDAATWPTLIAKHRATIFIGVPTVFRQIIQKTAVSAKDVPTLRHCMSAGEHLSDEVLSRWHERFGREIYEAVGMSEMSYYLSQSRYRPIRHGSAGFPQPGHDIKLLDPEALAEVAIGEEGMICIPESDPGLFLSYWNQPDETARLKRDGWFFTGDYARYDEDGYLWFLGRRDDIIKSFGYRVSPYEVERVLKSHPAVADCACVGEDIEADKRLVVAYVIAQPGAEVSPDVLIAFGRAHLASYKAPKRIYLAREFPRTRNGKILRREITPRLALARSEN